MEVREKTKEKQHVPKLEKKNTREKELKIREKKKRNVHNKKVKQGRKEEERRKEVTGTAVRISPTCTSS